MSRAPAQFTAKAAGDLDVVSDRRLDKRGFVEAGEGIDAVVELGLYLDRQWEDLLESLRKRRIK